jgi:hypothetical protein
MARRIYWVSYPEKDKQGKINDFQTLLDWAYEDTVGYSETGVQYVQSQHFSVDFCEEDIILEDEEAAKEYILDEMYPDYSGFDLRAYDMHNCAVRFYKEVSKDSNKYRVFSRYFTNPKKYFSYLEEYQRLLFTILDDILSDKKLLYKLRVALTREAVNKGVKVKDTEKFIRDIFAVLKTSTSTKDIPNEVRSFVRILGTISTDDFLSVFKKVSEEIENTLYGYANYEKWETLISDILYINRLLSEAKEELKDSSKEEKEVYWLMYIEKRV